jgi:hypothetical protein
VDGRPRAHWSLEARLAGWVRRCDAGEELTIAPGVPHTVRANGGVRLRMEFSPALRSDHLLEEMFGCGARPRLPAFVPPPLRAWLEGLGFGAEIRYLWPRRVVGVLLATAVLSRAWRRSASVT